MRLPWYLRPSLMLPILFALGMSFYWNIARYSAPVSDWGMPDPTTYLVIALLGGTVMGVLQDQAKRIESLERELRERKEAGSPDQTFVP